MDKRVIQLAIATDYIQGVGTPQPYLQRIAESGFTHVHWCHHWNTDFIYSPAEIKQIRKWLKDYHLHLLDLHGPVGKEKNWYSRHEHERHAGVELVMNRIHMTHKLGGRAVVMHIPPEPRDDKQNIAFWDGVLRSLDTLEPFARRRNIKIALENLEEFYPLDNYSTIEKILSLYDASFVGVCYDAGHGNRMGDGLEWLNKIKQRLIAVHLHDNDGSYDQHMPLFTGSVNWNVLAQRIAASSYDLPISMELHIKRSGFADEQSFLDYSYSSGARLTELIWRYREESPSYVFSQEEKRM